MPFHNSPTIGSHTPQNPTISKGKGNQAVTTFAVRPILAPDNLQLANQNLLPILLQLSPNTQPANTNPKFQALPKFIYAYPLTLTTTSKQPSQKNPQSSFYHRTLYVKKQTPIIPSRKTSPRLPSPTKHRHENLKPSTQKTISTP